MVTLHVPETKATAGLIGAAELARMKPRRLPPQRRPRRGSSTRRPSAAASLRRARLGGAGDRRLRGRAADGLAAPRRAEHGPDAAPGRVHRGGPGGRRRGGVAAGPGRPGRPSGALRGQRAAPDARDGAAIAPYLPLAETLGRFFAQFARGAVNTLTLEVAGELADHDVTPLQAAVLRGLLEGDHHGAGQPGQRRPPRPGQRASPSSSGRRPTPARSRRW